MRTIFYLVQKEFRQIFRDRVMVAILFVAPLVQIVILGHAITTDVVHVRMVVCDHDNSPLSRTVIDAFTHTPYFDVQSPAGSEREVRNRLDGGKASVGLVIPAGFHRAVIRGDAPPVQVLVDGIDGNTAGVALGYASDIIQRVQRQILDEEPRLGLPLRDRHRVELEPRFWYNPELASRRYVVPGIIALILLIITVFLTSMGIVREREIGTLDQLMVTPIRSWQLVLGKVLPFSILGFIEINIAIAFVYLLFGIGIEGSYLLLMFESALFLLTTLGLGIFISTISETQQQALFVAWFFMIFGILLSGFFIPIPNMPDTIQTLTLLNPLRYFLVILREIYLKGAGLTDILRETLSMLAFGVLVLTAAVFRFRKQLK